MSAYNDDLQAHIARLQEKLILMNAAYSAFILEVRESHRVILAWIETNEPYLLPTIKEMAQELCHNLEQILENHLASGIPDILRKTQHTQMIKDI